MAQKRITINEKTINRFTRKCVTVVGVPDFIYLNIVVGKVSLYYNNGEKLTVVLTRSFAANCTVFNVGKEN